MRRMLPLSLISLFLLPISSSSAGSKYYRAPTTSRSVAVPLAIPLAVSSSPVAFPSGAIAMSPSFGFSPSMAFSPVFATSPSFAFSSPVALSPSVLASPTMAFSPSFAVSEISASPLFGVRTASFSPIASTSFVVPPMSNQQVLRSQLQAALRELDSADATSRSPERTPAAPAPSAAEVQRAKDMNDRIQQKLDRISAITNNL